MAQEIALLVNIFYFIYTLIRNVIEYLLSTTLYQANPTYAERYADAISMLIPITVIWVVLEFAEGFKKFVRFIVIIGWALVLISILITFI